MFKIRELKGPARAANLLALADLGGRQATLVAFSEGCRGRREFSQEMLRGGREATRETLISAQRSSQISRTRLQPSVIDGAEFRI